MEEVPVAADENPETVLVLDARGQFLPMSTQALTLSDAAERRIEELYLGAVLIYRNGEVRRIDQIEFDGPWGDTIWRRLLSALNKVRRITVQLADLPSYTLSEIKEIVSAGLSRDSQLPDPFFRLTAPLPEVLGLVDSATTCEEIFTAIGVPEPRNALDSLC